MASNKYQIIRIDLTQLYASNLGLILSIIGLLSYKFSKMHIWFLKWINGIGGLLNW